MKVPNMHDRALALMERLEGLLVKPFNGPARTVREIIESLPDEELVELFEEGTR